MQRKASAVWKGGLKDGQGTVSSASGILSNTKYSFKTRFEDAPGTNPEELIAAAITRQRRRWEFPVESGSFSGGGAACSTRGSGLLFTGRV